MRNTIKILGVDIDNLTMDESMERIRSFLEEEKVHAVYTPNSEILMEAQRDSELMQILNEGDLVTPDGAGVILASRILGTPLVEKVSGVDLVYKILDSKKIKRPSIFILGGKPGIAEKACINITDNYPSVRIAGYHHGYFSEKEGENIIDIINNSNVDILMVGLGAPKQEKWIHENKGKLKVKVCMGVGGSIDILSGTVKLTPEFIRKAGFEWLHRLLREPRRYKRMLDLPKFMLKVLKKRFFSKST